MRCFALSKSALVSLNFRVPSTWHRFDKRQAVDDDEEDGDDPDAMEL